MGKKYLLGFLMVVYLGFGLISVVHTIEFWEITNEPTYAIVLAVVNSIAIVSAIWISFYSKAFSRLIFGVTFAYEVFGNVFYSYHWLNENIGSKFFTYWCDLNQWIYEAFSADPNLDTYHNGMQIVTSWLQGGVVPTLQAIIFYALIKLIPTPEITQTVTMDSSQDTEIDPPNDLKNDIPNEPPNEEPESIIDTTIGDTESNVEIEPPIETPIETIEPPIETPIETIEPPMEPPIDTIDPPIELPMETENEQTLDTNEDIQVEDNIVSKEPEKVINKKLYNLIKDDFKAQFKDIVNDNPSDLEKNIKNYISEKGKKWKLKNEQ